VAGVGGGEGAGGAGGDVAEVAPRPGAVGDLRVVEEAARPRGAIAGDEGGAFLLREAQAHLAGEPVVDVDRGVVEEGGGGGRHGVELHGGEGELGQGGRVGLGTGGGLGDPAGLGAGDGERLLVDGAGDPAHLGDGADGRDVAHAAVDSGLQLLG